MLKVFIDKLSDDFKQKLLAQTQDEVNEIFKGQAISDIDKKHIDMFFVQPLYYAKLESFSNIWMLQNEMSIEQVLKSDELTDTDKELFFSTLSSKMGISSSNINQEMAQILNKYFVNSGNIFPIAKSALLDTGEEVSQIIVGNNYPKFNSLLYEFANDNFYAPMIVDNLKSDFNIASIFSAPIEQEAINRYISANTDFFLKENALLIINPDNTFETKQQSVNLGSGDTQIININGYISDVNIDLDNPKLVDINMDTPYGFSNNTISITVKGPNSGTVKYHKYTPSAKLLAAMSSDFEGIPVELTNSFKVHCSFTVDDTSMVSLFSEYLGHYQSKIQFFENLKDILQQHHNINSIPSAYSAKIYINPFVYLQIPFSPFGIDFMYSKLLNSTPEELFSFKLTDIYIKGSDGHITL